MCVERQTDRQRRIGLGCVPCVRIGGDGGCEKLSVVVWVKSWVSCLVCRLFWEWNVDFLCVVSVRLNDCVF